MDGLVRSGMIVWNGEHRDGVPVYVMTFYGITMRERSLIEEGTPLFDGEGGFPKEGDVAITDQDPALGMYVLMRPEILAAMGEGHPYVRAMDERVAEHLTGRS
jgi:hypothetical protein